MNNTLPAGHMLMWYDDSKRPVAIKLRDAITAYTARYGVPPAVAFVNEAEVCAADGVAVETRGWVRANNVWLGRAE